MPAHQWHHYNDILPGADFIQAGYVHYQYHSFEGPQQIGVYNDCIQKYSGNHTWIGGFFESYNDCVQKYSGNHSWIDGCFCAVFEDVISNL